MSIRFECPECASVLKIKDALAGTEGKCPKCKTPFTVPSAGSASDSRIVSDETSPGTAESATTAAPVKPKGRAKVEAAAADDAEFDPVAFLMAGGAPPKKPAKPTPAARGKVDDGGAGLSLDDSEPAAKPKSRPKSPDPAPAPAAASAAASANSMLSASSNAKDLLTRTVEESRARAAEMPEETKVPFIDTAQLRMLLFTRILPYGGGTIVLCGFLYWFMSSMVGGGFEMPDELIRAEGVVLINGEPKEGVIVKMRPFTERAPGERWRTSIGVTNEDGEFEMMYLEGYPGIVPGRQNVSLSYIVNGFETINTEYLEPGKIETYDEANYEIKLESTAIIREPRPAPPDDE